MATFDTDVSVTIYGISTETVVGQRSSYASTPHPGTNKKIEGWKWDQRTWPSELEFDAAAFAPSIWDPAVSGINLESFQSGYGDNKDLLLLDISETFLNNKRVWAPKLEHGYYYVKNDEWYLYSDGMLTEYMSSDPAELINGNQELQLTHRIKPTIPVSVTQYRFDPVTAGYVKDKEFRHTPEFTVSGTDYEFLLDDKTDPYTVVVSGLHTEDIGIPVVSLPADIAELEVVGISTGDPLQSFNTTYSPIDKYPSGLGDVEVWVWTDPSTAVQWTVLDSSTSFTAGANTEAQVDFDLGTVSFGDYDATDNPTGAGSIPAAGARIGVYYAKTLAIEYEPEHTVDCILGTTFGVDVNPLNSASESGFIQLTTESLEPAEITLTSDLIGGTPFLIDLGNNIGRMTATVKNKSGQLLSSQEVTFELVAPKIGTFGATAQEIDSTTGANGQATVLYNSPATILDVGRATNNVVHSGPDTIITVSDLIDPGILTGLATYKVHEYDEVLGIPTASGVNYYTNYLSEEDIIDDPDGTPATQTYEEQYRNANNLDEPTTYGVSDLSSGRKTILFDATNAGVMNPHAGKLDATALSPLYPSSITNIGTTTSPVLELKYDGINLPLILSEANDRTKSYFVVGDALTTVQAYVTNTRTGQRITSNQIQVRVQIPDTVNGSFFADLLGDVPDGLLTKVKNVDDLTDSQITATQSITSLGLDDSYLEERLDTSETYVDWFRRTRRGDTILMTSAAQLIPDPAVSGLDTVQPDPSAFPSEIPLGFRLRSTGITLASALDQVTFLDGNSTLPSDYFDITSSVGVLGNAFTVI